MKWTWDWTPFVNHANFGDNPFWDWVRVGCVLIGMLQIMMIGRVMVESKFQPVPMPRTQYTRFIALALTDISISLTEVAVVGTPATPRLLINILGLGFGLYGVWGMRYKQKHSLPVAT